MMIELKIGFESSHLQGLAKLSPKDGLDADGVPRLGEDGDGFDRQDFPDTREFLCQSSFVRSAHFH